MYSLFDSLTVYYTFKHKFYNFLFNSFQVRHQHAGGGRGLRRTSRRRRSVRRTGKPIFSAGSVFFPKLQPRGGRRRNRGRSGLVRGRPRRSRVDGKGGRSGRTRRSVSRSSGNSREKTNLDREQLREMKFASSRSLRRVRRFKVSKDTIWRTLSVFVKGKGKNET